RPGGGQGRADIRWRRLCGRLWYRTLLPRRAHLPLVRGHEPDPADRHRAANVAWRRMTAGTSELRRIVADIRACRICAADIEPRPILRASATAKLCLVGQ